MEAIKGNLHNPREHILEIKIRNLNGIPVHKAELKMEDSRTLIKEINLWKEKFGVHCLIINKNFEKLDLNNINTQVQNEKKKLINWREKSKGLRNDNMEFREQLKKLL